MTAEPRGYVLGVDIGGTFTDVAMLDVDTGEQWFYKAESTPRAPEQGVINGITGILQAQGREPDECLGFVHGTTLALNAILTRSGARLGLLATRGFGDVLEIGRLQMPDPFNFYTQKPVPLVRKKYVAEVVERVLSNGDVLTPLSEEAVLRGVERLTAIGVEAIAICFVNAYKNPVHELAAAEIIRRHYPSVTVSLSSQVWPEIREYERTMVTVMSAYVAPKVAAYLTSLQQRIEEVRLAGPVYVTTSNGGMLPARLAKERPGTTLLSGPAAGVIASAQLAETCGMENVVAVDMGGTSADIAMITKGQIPYSTETRVGDFPVIFPSVDVSSVGAGGGSIARLDNVGVLKVGPASAGADPGPACYGRGGTQPTVTDAYLTTGILDPEGFLGGRLRLRPRLAHEALSQIARQTRYSVHELSAGVLRVATSNLLVGVARVEAHKGIDIRDFTLLAYGGAGPTHACFLAEELGIRRVAVPPSPGTFCAWGSLLADLRLDWVQTFHQPVGDMSLATLRGWFAERQAEGRKLLGREALVLEGIHGLKSADMRYRGQGHNLEVALSDQLLSGNDPGAIADAFHRRYQEVYGTADSTLPVEFINARLTVVGLTRKQGLRELLPGTGRAPDERRARQVFFDGGVHRAPAFLRSRLPVGFQHPGPCLVDQSDSTVFVRPSWTLAVDHFGILHLERRDA